MLFLLYHSSVAQEKPEVDSSYANGYFVERHAFFEQLVNGENEIIFLGNSITEAGDWQEIILGHNVANRGISGDNSFGVYARMDEVLDSQPAKIFLMIGINDIKRGNSVEAILKNHEKIVKKVRKKSPKTQLFIQSVLPVREVSLANNFEKITNEKIRNLNRGLIAIAKSHGLVYVDLHNDVFLDENGQLPRALTTDGLHLKPTSYFLWVEYLRKKKFL